MLSPKSFVTAAIIALGFVFCLAADLPGHLSYDSVIQLLEGRTAAYSGWHPPLMSWLLGLTDAIIPGTSLFVVFDALLFFGALFSLAWLRPVSSWLAAPVATLIVASPIALLYQGIVWKDVVFADCMVAGFVALAWAAARWNNPRQRFALLALSFVLLGLAAMARQNGLLAIACAAAALGWIASLHDRQRWRTGLIYGGAALALAAMFITSANVALGWRIVSESGPAKQIRLLELYDIIGVVTADPTVRLDILKSQTPDLEHEVRTDGVRLYNPERNDPLAASQRLSADLNDEDTFAPVRAQWLNVIAHHPLTYLKVRAEVFRWIFATPDISVCLPYLAGVSGPEQQMQKLGIEERDDNRDEALSRYASAFIQTPVLSHVFYALLSLVSLILLLRRYRPEDIAIAALQASALLFTASFFVIGIACDYRYLYALDLSALVAVFYIALDWSDLTPTFVMARLSAGHPVDQ
jgi:hypothetical protein